MEQGLLSSKVGMYVRHCEFATCKRKSAIMPLLTQLSCLNASSMVVSSGIGSGICLVSCALQYIRLVVLPSEAALCLLPIRGDEPTPY